MRFLRPLLPVLSVHGIAALGFPNADRGLFAVSEAYRTVHRPFRGRFEWHGGRCATICTGGRVLRRRASHVPRWGVGIHSVFMLVRNNIGRHSSTDLLGRGIRQVSQF